jgi:hypothetical protein
MDTFPGLQSKVVVNVDTTPAKHKALLEWESFPIPQNPDIYTHEKGRPDIQGV